MSNYRPTLIANVFDLADPGADTGVLNAAGASAARRTPSHDGWWDISIAPEVTSVAYLTCTDGSTPHRWELFDGAALTAGTLYDFSFAVSAADQSGNPLTYDIELATTGGKVERLIAYERHYPR